jgi:uncharacterized protein (DUF1501 family)
MRFTRRAFVRGGVSAFTVGFAAPRFLSDLALAQGAAFRNLVVLYLGGGNDSLSMLVPYRDTFYQSRRPTLAVPAGQVLQIGRDSAGNELGLHPRLTGLKTIFNEGRLALIQRTGYENSSRSHFEGTDIWSTANPLSTAGPGWLGRYLDTIPRRSIHCTHGTPAPKYPHSLLSRLVSVPSISNPAAYAFQSPNGTAEAASRAATRRCGCRRICRRTVRTWRSSTRALSRRSQPSIGCDGGRLRFSVTYPASGFAQALRAVAGALATQIGTRVFWVQTGGYDTHAAQSGSYRNADDYAERRTAGVLSGLEQQRAAERHADSAVLRVRAACHRERQRRHRSRRRERHDGDRRQVRGGIYGTAPSLSPDPANPTLENAANDVRFETDFRSVLRAASSTAGLAPIRRRFSAGTSAAARSFVN